MTAYPTLGFDPVGNDEATSREIATKLRTTTNRLLEVKDVLSGTGDQEWQGRTAVAFRDSVDGELRPRVEDAWSSFDVATRAFDNWVDSLWDYRRRADDLEIEAREVAERVSAASSALSGLTAPGADAPQADKDDYDKARGDARDLLTSRQGELEGVLTRARSLKTEVEDHADQVATSLQTAMDAAPDEPGFWGKLGEAISDVVTALGEAFDWFMEHVAPIIQKLAKIIGAIATILAIVAFVVGFVFPPAFALAGTLGTIAKVASFVDLGIQGLRVLHGEPGALQGFALSAGSMLLGMGIAKGIGPIATNATTNIRNGPLVPVLAGVSVGTNGGAAVATQAIQINPDFFHSMVYWGITSYQDLKGSGDTLDEEL